MAALCTQGSICFVISSECYFLTKVYSFEELIEWSSITAQVPKIDMEFRNVASTEAQFLDKDTQEVMSKYQPVFMEYSILAE